jgi:hypothetical protein
MFTKHTETNQATAVVESQGRSRVTMVLALLTIGGIATFLFNLTALHFVRPDVNPVLEPMSSYAVGPYGFLFIGGNARNIVVRQGRFAGE